MCKVIQKEKKRLELRVESLQSELSHKERSITELSERYAQLNDDTTKAKDHNKKLESQIIKICSIQTNHMHAEQESIQQKLLQREKEYYMLRARYSDVLSVLSKKMDSLKHEVDYSDKKDRGRSEKQKIYTLKAALGVLQTQFCADRIRFHVREEELLEIKKGFDENSAAKDQKISELNRTIEDLNKQLGKTSL